MGDCEETRLWIVEPAEIETELLSAKTLVKPIEYKIVPMRVLNLPATKAIYKKSEVGQCAPVETVINKE